MGVALSVFRLVRTKSGANLVRDLTNPRQLKLDDHEIGHGLPSPRSELTLVKNDEKAQRAYYRAVHHSRTIDQEIRVSAKEIIEGIEDAQVTVGPVDILENPRNSQTAVRKEYQEIHRFEVIIDFKENEILVFAKKDTATDFMRRFKAKGLVEYAHIYFDLGRIEEIPDLANVFGAWMSGKGNVTKRALFGTEVHKEDGNEEVTSYEVVVEDGDETKDFFIAHDCRISSRMKHLTNDDLVEKWAEFKKALGVHASPVLKKISK